MNALVDEVLCDSCPTPTASHLSAERCNIHSAGPDLATQYVNRALVTFGNYLERALHYMTASRLRRAYGCMALALSAPSCRVTEIQRRINILWSCSG